MNLPQTELAQKIVQTLRDRGIEATPDQVFDWATKTAEKYHRFRGGNSNPDTWMKAVLNKNTIPTMILHLHFGHEK